MRTQESVRHSRHGDTRRARPDPCCALHPTSPIGVKCALIRPSATFSQVWEKAKLFTLYMRYNFI